MKSERRIVERAVLNVPGMGRQRGEELIIGSNN